MMPTQGAGQRLKSEFISGQIYVDNTNSCVRNQNNQEFFVTSNGRIMRHDKTSDQFNVYDTKSKDFVPCDGLEQGEQVVRYATKKDLRDALVALPGWGDWLATKGMNAGAAIGKQLVWATTCGIVGAAAGPFFSRSVNKLMDSVGYTAPGAGHAIAQPSIETGVRTGVQAKAAGINAIRGHAKPGIAEAASGLRAARQQARVIHDPQPFPIWPRPRPRCPVTDPFFPNGPFVPFGPNVDPVGPWVPYQLGEPPLWLHRVGVGIAAGGTTASGAVVGALVGGPVGGVLGGALGAGVGAFFG